MPTRFKFDPAASPDVSLEAFLQHLENDEPEFGAMLRMHLPLVFPSGSDRLARAEFNRRIAEQLDAPRTDHAKAAPGDDGAGAPSRAGLVEGAESA